MSQPTPLSLDPVVPVDAPARSPVRVAFFSDAFPERNGTGAYYHDLLAQLAPRVDAVTIFQPSTEGPRPLLSIPMPGDPGQRLATPSLPKVRAACDALDPTLVVVVTPGLYGLLGVLEARRRGATLLSAFHTDFEQLARMYWNPLSRFFVNLVLRTANRFVCSRSESVLINNRGLEREVRRLGAAQVEVIGTPLARDFMERPLMPIAPALRRVCFAGRLAPEKNVEHIIAAARALPAVEFVIAGEGPLRPQLEALAEGCDNIRFVGWLERGALIDLIDDASVLLLPSAFETFGSVALEAMARGRPPLVSVTAGIHSWPELRDGLFALDAPEELAVALAEIAALSPEDWRRRSAAARSNAEGLHAGTLDHWVRLLDAHGPARLAAGNG